MPQGQAQCPVGLQLEAAGHSLVCISSREGRALRGGAAVPASASEKRISRVNLQVTGALGRTQAPKCRRVGSGPSLGGGHSLAAWEASGSPVAGRRCGWGPSHPSAAGWTVLVHSALGLAPCAPSSSVPDTWLPIH